MTLSEYVQAWRIRDASPPLLVCGNGSEFSVDAGASVLGSFPRDDAGPWTQFNVVLVRGPIPREFTANACCPRVMQAGDIVRMLERLGWPEAQLGKRWKSKRAEVTR